MLSGPSTGVKFGRGDVFPCLNSETVRGERREMVQRKRFVAVQPWQSSPIVMETYSPWFFPGPLPFVCLYKYKKYICERECE